MDEPNVLDMRSQYEIINRTHLNENHITGPRLQSERSLLERSSHGCVSATTASIDDVTADLNSSNRSYPVMLKLIMKSIEKYQDYSHLFQDDDANACGNSDSTSPSLSASDEHQSNYTIPSLKDFAHHISEQESKTMDDKQYITYETICATFLLGLVSDASNFLTPLGAYLNNNSRGDHSEALTVLTKELKAMGAERQLRMFLSGPAGSGKTTAVKIAERFCYKFCSVMGKLWTDRTFLFTAYTGSAASCFGGITICKAAFISKSGDLSPEEKSQWKHVRILIIDEISFMTDREIIQLNKRLKECRDSTQVYGGVSIIFAGDFRQLRPHQSSSHDLLYSRKSSCLWEDTLNAVIFLDNVH